MKLYVAIVGLISLVPNGDGLTALLPKIKAWEVHQASLGLNLQRQIPATVLDLDEMPFAEVDFTGSGGGAPRWLGYDGTPELDRFIRFSQIFSANPEQTKADCRDTPNEPHCQAARVDDDCLATPPSDTCRGKLAARVTARGAVSIHPINYPIDQGTQTLRPSEVIWTRSYGFKGTRGEAIPYKGVFSSATFLSLDVPDDEVFAFQVTGATLTIRQSSVAECAVYAAVAHHAPGQKCFLAMIADVPYDLSEPAKRNAMDHFELLASLLETPPQVVPTMVWLNMTTGGTIFGNGVHVTCPGGRMEP
jgi:hypothetical protein